MPWENKVQIDLGIRNAGEEGKSEQAFKGAKESGKLFFLWSLFFFLKERGSHNRIRLYHSEVEFLSHELAAKSGYLRYILQFLQRSVPM